MKGLLLLLLACVNLCLAQAQDNRTITEHLQEELKDDLSLVNYHQQKYSGNDTSVIGTIKPWYLVTPTPGIHHLPQDNMPCLVPDLNTTVAIPNAWGEIKVPFNSKTQRIPNPAKPFRLSPSRPLLIHPEDDSNTK